MSDEELGRGLRQASQMERLQSSAEKSKTATNCLVALILALLVLIIFVGGFAYMAGWINL